MDLPARQKGLTLTSFGSSYNYAHMRLVAAGRSKRLMERYDHPTQNAPKTRPQITWLVPAYTQNFHTNGSEIQTQLVYCLGLTTIPFNAVPLLSHPPRMTRKSSQSAP